MSDQIIGAAARGSGTSVVGIDHSSVAAAADRTVLGRSANWPTPGLPGIAGVPFIQGLI
jgi:hypothetical protein